LSAAGAIADHAHPEHLTVAGFDIVFAYESELAVLADAEHRQASRHEPRPGAVFDRQSPDMRGDQKAPARIDVKVATVNTARVGVLDHLRFAACRIDREHRQIVLAADKHAGLVGRGGAVRDIGKPPAWMQLDRADRLPAADVAGLGERVLLEHRLPEQRAGLELEHVEPVLPLERNVDPGLRRMEIEVARPKTVAAIWRDRCLVGQHAVTVIEHLQRARLLGLPARGVMAARHQDNLLVVETDPHLVAVDPGVDRLGLRDLRARNHVRIDTIDLQPAWIAERDEDVLGRDVQGHVDRPGRQCDPFAMRRQRARIRFDLPRAHMVLCAGKTADSGGAVARGDIQIPARGVRPGVMDIGGRRDGAAALQRGALDIDGVMRQFRPDSGIKRDPVAALGHRGVLIEKL